MSIVGVDLASPARGGVALEMALDRVLDEMCDLPDVPVISSPEQVRDLVWPSSVWNRAAVLADVLRYIAELIDGERSARTLGALVARSRHIGYTSRLRCYLPAEHRGKLGVIMAGVGIAEFAYRRAGE